MAEAGFDFEKVVAIAGDTEVRTVIYSYLINWLANYCWCYVIINNINNIVVTHDICIRRFNQQLQYCKNKISVCIYFLLSTYNLTTCYIYQYVYIDYTRYAYNSN